MFNYHNFFFLNNCHYKTADAILNCNFFVVVVFLFGEVTQLQKHCFSGQKKGFAIVQKHNGKNVNQTNFDIDICRKKGG